MLGVRGKWNRRRAGNQKRARCAAHNPGLPRMPRVRGDERLATPWSAIPVRSCFAARSRASGRAAEAGMHGLPELLPRRRGTLLRATRAMCPMAAAGQITMADSADCPAAIVAAWSS